MHKAVALVGDLVSIEKKRVYNRNMEKIMKKGLIEKEMRAERRRLKPLTNKFVICVDEWHGLSDEEQVKWNKKGTMREVTGFNLYVSKCQNGVKKEGLWNFSEEEKKVKYSLKDVVEAMKMTYNQTGDDTPVSEYNNQFIINLKRFR